MTVKYFLPLGIKSFNKADIILVNIAASNLLPMTTRSKGIIWLNSTVEHSMVEERREERGERREERGERRGIPISCLLVLLIP